MIAEKFARFVMQSRKHAILTALVLAVLPLFNWLSIVVIALVTLRKGIWEGLIVLLWAALPYIVSAFFGHWLPLLSGVVFGSFLVWCLALILRRTASWVVTIECAVIVGVCGVLLVHWLVPDIAAWWLKQITTNVDHFIHIVHFQLKEGQVDTAAQMIAAYATGIQASIILLVGLIELIIGRFLQATLYNPGGFRKEWLSLRFNFVPIIVLGVVGVLTWYGPSLFKDVFPVVVLPFVLAGVSLVHGSLDLMRVSSTVIFLFYLLLLIAFIFMPVILGLFVVLATLDGFLDFRSKLSAQMIKKDIK